MTMATIEVLKGQLEESIKKVCKIDNGQIKLQDDLTIGDIMELKSVESVINNILVVAQTCAFAEKIGEPGIMENIANPNAKGFDVDCNSGATRILAELKATVPCGDNDTYGSNQAKSISKDLKNLLGISDKGKDANIDSVKGRYIVLIDVPGQQNAFNKLKELKEYKERIEKEITPIFIDPKIGINEYDERGWKEKT